MTEPDFILTKRREFAEHLAMIRAQAAQIPAIERGLAALNGEEYTPEPDYRALYERTKLELRAARRTISQLESGRKDGVGVGAKSQMARNGGPGLAPDEQYAEQTRAQEAAADLRERKPHTVVSVEDVRDCIVNHFSSHPFSTPMLADKLGVSATTARAKLGDLPDGMIRRPEGTPRSGPHARWEYVMPPATAPTTRPRGTERGPRGERAPVAHTGRPKGPTDRPSDLRTPPGTLRRKKTGGKAVQVGAS